MPRLSFGPRRRDMLTRNPVLFLQPLANAFFARTTTTSISRRNAHFFYAAKFASIARLIALDRVIPEFEKLSKEARTTERMFEEDQLLYEFFSHAYPLVDSFCFGAYFVGAQLSPSHFKPNPNLRSVNPRKTRDYFEKFDASSAFTKELKAVLGSPE